MGHGGGGGNTSARFARRHALCIRPRRNYADGPAGAHVLGYLGEIGPKQLKEFKAEGYEIGDEIGQYGLERKWEQDLRGQSGGQQVEVDALGRRVRVLLRSD